MLASLLASKLPSGRVPLRSVSRTLRDKRHGSVSSSQLPVRPRLSRSTGWRGFKDENWLHTCFLFHFPLFIKAVVPGASTMTGHTTEVATLPPQRASTPDQHFAKTEMPALESRWVHTGAKYLQLLPTPITVAETEYKAFSELENQRIEAAWQALPEEKRERVISEWGREDGEGGEQPDQVKISKSPRKPSTPTTELDDTGDVPSDPELLDSDLEDDRPRKDEQYRAIIERNYHDPDQLDVVEGVAVSQVRRQ